MEEKTKKRKKWGGVAMRKKAVLLSCILILLLPLAGCVGKKEISDLAIVMAVGIDEGKEAGSVKVSVQVARPADARGQTGAPAGQSGEAIWNVEAEGESIFEAIRKLSSISTRRIFWAHNFIIVINEQVAKEGIGGIIDFFSRNQELRMRTKVVITPDSASEIVSTATGLEIIPGEAMDKLFRYSAISSVSAQSDMMELLAAYLSPSSEPLLARVILQKMKVDSEKAEAGASLKQIELAGAGVFKDDKLVGILKPEEMRGVIAFRDKLDSGALIATCPSNPNKNTTIELDAPSFRVEPTYHNQEIRFKATLDVDVSVVEAGCSFAINNKEQVKTLQNSVEDTLRKQIMTTVNKVQKDYQADVFELGKVFQNKYPYEWKKYKNNWSEIFSTTNIDVVVHSEVVSGELLFKPTESGKKEKSKE